MSGFVVGRFLADRPMRPGMVRAILDTLSAQGGPYEPHLVRRASGEAPSRITWSRPVGLLDEVTQGGRHTTFLRVAEGRPEPVLTLRISATPRTQPSLVSLSVPEESLTSSQEIERILGVCKGLYLFLESPWGTVHRRLRAADVEPADAGPRANDDRGDAPSSPCHLAWANFFGPHVVARVGLARLLTSTAFIVEILPDGGIMLVSHPAPSLADSAEGRAARTHLEEITGVGDVLRAMGLVPGEGIVGRPLSSPRVRRRLRG